MEKNPTELLFIKILLFVIGCIFIYSFYTLFFLHPSEEIETLEENCIARINGDYRYFPATQESLPVKCIKFIQ